MTSTSEIVEPGSTAPQAPDAAQRRVTATVPSVGRDVHQVGRGSADGHYPPEIRAGKITGLGDEDGTVDLVIWPREGQLFMRGVPYHEGDASTEPPFSPFYRCPHTGLAYPGGTWHWPPMVGPRR